MFQNQLRTIAAPRRSLIADGADAIALVFSVCQTKPPGIRFIYADSAIVNSIPEFLLRTLETTFSSSPSTRDRRVRSDEREPAPTTKQLSTRESGILTDVSTRSKQPQAKIDRVGFSGTHVAIETIRPRGWIKLDNYQRLPADPSPCSMGEQLCSSVRSGRSVFLGQGHETLPTNHDALWTLYGKSLLQLEPKLIAPFRFPFPLEKLWQEFDTPVR